MSWSHCIVRIAGDLSLAASFPILITRILRKGVAGVSVTTHGLHLIVFLARYLDLMTDTGSFSQTQSWKEWFLMWYNPLAKLYFLHAASAVILSICYVRVRDQLSARKSAANEFKTNFFSELKSYALYVLPMAFLAYRFHYGQHSYLYEPFSTPTSSFEPTTETDGLEHVFGWFKSAIEFFSPADLFLMDGKELMEVAWSFSIYLAAVADVPQYVTYYYYLGSRTSIDWWLMTNMLLTAMFRLFYIPHWVIRFTQEGTFDPIVFTSGVVQVFVFWMFFILCFNKVNNNFSDNGHDEEAQWDEYESRWGATVETYAGEWDGLLLHAEGQPLQEEKPAPLRIIPVIRVEDVDAGRPPVLPQ